MDKPKTLLDGFGEATDQVVALRAELAAAQEVIRQLREALKGYGDDAHNADLDIRKTLNHTAYLARHP